MLYWGGFGGPVALGGGLAFTRQKYGGLISHKPRCLSIFFTCLAYA